MHKKHRIFVAVSLPQEFKRKLASFQKQYAELPAKWVEQDNLHITLAFPGSITDLQLGEVSGMVEDIVNSYQSFDVTLKELVYDGSGKIPRYLWVTLEKSSALRQLAGDLNDQLRLLVPMAHQAFSPHVTLARINAMGWRMMEAEEQPIIHEALDLSFVVDSVEIMESETKRGGSRYTVIESFALSSL